MTTSRGPATVLFLVAAVELLIGVGFLIAGTIAVGAALMLGGLLLCWLGMRFNVRAARARALRERGVAGTVDWEFTPSAGAAEIERAVAAPAPVDPAEAARDKAHILATGVSGTVRVLSAEFAGSLDERGRPVYSAQLHIQVEGRDPVAGPAVFAVPLERVSVMRPGGVIPIKADPYDPRKFAADWDRLITP
ncbi:hypothetical protein ABT297_10385 [Dactylosporangium sp. NPDC000555]|uniref:hypothetical protein n=1 Tax=Dactylosporangium sp. NPDC000555 TaxID=3154260 RepID=UPI0033293E09